MKNVLVVSGHTDLKNSVANKTILTELEKELPGAEFDYLDRLYPDFRIDAEAERRKLIRADIIALQFPLFWYSVPSLMSRWIEETFVHGFSHGSSGDKLHGKKLVASFTAGAPEDMYRRGGGMGYEAEDFLAPIKAMCGLCGMEFAGFIFTCGVSYLNRSDAGERARTEALAKDHARRLTELLKTL